MNDSQRLEALERAARRCLALLEQGRSDAAWSELAGVLEGGAEPGPVALSDAELERAFEVAHPVEEEVVDADRVALDAIREVDGEVLTPLEDPPARFATVTMAELLERQGDVEGARRIRASMAGRTARREPTPARAPAPPPGAARGSERERVVATLERWLANLRGGASA